MREIAKELAKILPGKHEIQLIREKFGITVFRVKTSGVSYIGKHFNNKQVHGRKEIVYYAMLRSIGVPTLRVTAQTERLLLLEDIETSDTIRLATEQDMSDCAIARLIAKWFQQLHTCGRNISDLPQLGLLDNLSELNTKNIKHAMRETNSRDNPVWPVVVAQLGSIKATHVRLCNTITYNDFWHDNMAVARDSSSALMFDYNCIYRGYAYSDIRHILSVLPPDAGNAFLDAYGPYSAEEKALEELLFPLTGLLSDHASKFEALLHNGELMQRVRTLEPFL